MSLLYITEEVVENFSGSGMDLLFEVLESYQENDAESEEILAQIFTELLITFEENKLDVNDIKKFFTQAIKSDDQARIFSKYSIRLLYRKIYTIYCIYFSETIKSK